LSDYLSKTVRNSTRSAAVLDRILQVELKEQEISSWLLFDLRYCCFFLYIVDIFY
jgi:hypothetical protein